MGLQEFWFLIIAVLWIGYFCLEGFDFGVGMLFPILGRGQDAERRKRVLLNTIGPVWDGNEVWLLTAGGATFAAFPEWYATLFSGFYLALFLILIALIIRALGFEYRGKRDSDAWRRGWDWCITIGSYLPALLWGVAFVNIVRGVPIDANHEYTGNLLTLLNPIALLGGLTTLSVFLLHGLNFVSLKTTGQIRDDARALATKVWVVAAVLTVALMLILNIEGGSLWSWLAFLIAVVACVGGFVAHLADREGWAFAGTFAAIAFVVASMFFILFPDVMPSSTNPDYSLTIYNASSSHLTLQIMTVVAVIFTPIVLLYQGFTYWMFRKRISVDNIPPAQDERDLATV